MIDYGDALVKIDPLLDYVSVFVTILNSRREQDVMDVLLNSFRDLVETNRRHHLKPEQPQQQLHGMNAVSMARRCLWHVLLWPSEGLSLHLTQCVPEIGEMDTWQDVEEALFGWWSSL